MAEDAKSKPDAAARAARKRSARAERRRRGPSAPAPAGDDPTPLASRLQRIEDALTKQAELSEKLLVKVESLVAAGATPETDRAD